MMLVFMLTSAVMNRMLRRAEEQYIEKCSEVLDGYANAIYYYIENYHTSLSSIYNEELFATGDDKAIQQWLIQNIPFVHENFCTVFYIDAKTNVGYFSRGDVIDLTGKPYIASAEFDERGWYVSDFCSSAYSDSPVFIIEKAYVDSSRKLKGILCAAIKLDVLEEISSSIKIGNFGSVRIMDREGRFLVHPEREFIGKKFQPKAEKFEHITSEALVQSGSGFVETENYLGEEIDMFYKKIRHCGWTLGVAFRKENLKKVYSQQNSTKLMLVGIAIAALALLLLFEMLILDYFYKNQLIDAVYDPLTKLWTREQVTTQAQKIIHRNPKGKYMVIDADIRGIKVINQHYGMEEADKMIFYFSTILNRLTKEQHGLVGRGNADHFIIFGKVDNVRSAMTLLRKDFDIIMEECKDYVIPFFPKFGITFYRPERKREISVKELVSQATFAKNSIKNDMLKFFAIYDARLLEKVNEERALEVRMEAALTGGEFFVMYQPKISLADDRVVGAEALVRWKTPDRGILSPDKFIPLFERNGFIVKLDFYVYDKVFQFIDSQLRAGKPIVPISVNMSRNHNKPEKFMHEFMRLFRRYDIPPKLVQVEILERSIMYSNTLCETTNRLHQEGFTVAMDDFGTGESSLNMLTKIPVDVLKFDREFLLSSTNEDGALDEKSAKFIQSLIDLGKHLEKQTIFEGVETEAQRDFLRSISCDQVQGYFYSKPLMEQDFINFIREHV